MLGGLLPAEKTWPRPRALVPTGKQILAAFVPLLLKVCNNPGLYSNPELSAAASLALGKFCMIRWAPGGSTTLSGKMGMAPLPDGPLLAPVPLSATPSFGCCSPCWRSPHCPWSGLTSWLLPGIWPSASPTWWTPGHLICMLGERSLTTLEQASPALGGRSSFRMRITKTLSLVFSITLTSAWYLAGAGLHQVWPQRDWRLCPKRWL